MMVLSLTLFCEPAKRLDERSEERARGRESGTWAPPGRDKSGPYAPGPQPFQKGSGREALAAVIEPRISSRAAGQDFA
jgi:hypothetical protein